MRLTKFLAFNAKFWQSAKLALIICWRPATVKFFLITGLVLNLLNWMLAWLIIARLTAGQELAILHYNVLFGIDFIGSPWQIWLLPLYGLLLYLGNNLLALTLQAKDRLAAQILIGASLMVNLFLALALYSIYLINLL